MEKKEKNSKTEGKDIMRRIVSAIHLILIRVNNLQTCAHIWGLTNSRAHSCGWETWKDNHGLLVCCVVYLMIPSSVIPSTYHGMTEQKCKTKWEGCGCKVSRTNFRHYPRICRQRTRTTTKNLSQHSRRHG